MYNAERKKNPATTLEQAYKSIRTILEKARSKSFKAVNTLMVQAYWNIGKVIVEGEQRGKQRAEYGTALIEELSKRLAVEYDQGFNKTNLRIRGSFIFLSRISTHCVEN